jgi:hypothetical protein
MRKTILATTVALSAVLGATGMMIGGAGAQPAPPPGPGAAPSPPAHSGQMHGHHMHGMGPGGGPFALIYRPEDRQLTPAEVQKVAEAVLLWNGNRTWKVTDVAEAPDNAVGFAFATQDGSVVARFKMDRKTGRVTRTG